MNRLDANGDAVLDQVDKLFEIRHSEVPEVTPSDARKVQYQNQTANLRLILQEKEIQRHR